jgi:GTP-binding protein EngB required for normal cell division
MTGDRDNTEPEAGPALMADLRAELNDNHRRILASSLAYFDELLVTIETMASGAAARSPFSQYVPDLSASELHVLPDYVTEIRSRMAEMAAALGLGVARSTIPTSRAIDVTLLSADIALAEIRPEKLRGYGVPTTAGGAAVEHFTAELSRLIQQLRAVLARGTAADLAERVAHLDRAPIDLPGLCALQRIISAQGLVAFRDQLEALIERLERRTFEICMFGRVNAGKSSLLNAVLETDALPVGITPVTAVPTRIVFGAAAMASVQFGDGQRTEIPLARLPEFVSEAENPDNRKGVSSVLVRLPSPHLADGIAFVDTPGLGSLATAGARASYRYLPRCDLGILLIDASTPPSREDLDVLHLLHASEIPALVVLTKADLLSDSDLDRARDYARAQIGRFLDRDVPLHTVSSMGPAAARARAWFAQTIEPLCARGRELAGDACRQRFGHLLRAVAAVVRTEDSGEAGGARRYEQLEEVVAEAGRCLRDARSRCEAIWRQLPASLPDTLAAAVPVVVQRLMADGDAEVVGETVAVALDIMATRHTEAIEQELARARDRLQELLGQIGELGPAAGVFSMDRSRWSLGAAKSDRLLGSVAANPSVLRLDLIARPGLLVPAEIRQGRLDVPRWLRVIPPLLKRQVATALHRQFERSARDALSQLASELRTWAGRVLDDLGRQFAAQADPVRATARASVRRGETGTPTRPVDPGDLQTLEQLLVTTEAPHTVLSDGG